MQAIVLAVQALTSPGDEMVYLSPTWPNIVAAIGVAGAKAVPVGIDFRDGRWDLDIDRLESAITRKTKALFINTPSTRLDGQRRQTISVMFWRLPANMIFGSSPTRFMRFIIIPAATRRPSSM